MHFNVLDSKIPRSVLALSVFWCLTEKICIGIIHFFYTAVKKQKRSLDERKDYALGMSGSVEYLITFNTKSVV